MYQWYKRADRCYVYLGDVSKEDTPMPFAESQWFKRGWTLQELLAPGKVLIFDRHWQFLGDKQDLRDEIAHITGISPDILQTGDIARSSTAQKMSWAARRRTTRIEDEAYCLMGLFDINMPLLYGEENKEFLRRQEEIIEDSDDHSIFAWHMGRGTLISGLFTSSPANFTRCGRSKKSNTSECMSPYAMTNRGLSINLILTPWCTNIYLACLHVQEEQNLRLCIFLRRLREDDKYARIGFSECGVFVDTDRVLEDSVRPIRARQLYVRKRIKPIELSFCRLDHHYGYQIPIQCFCHKVFLSRRGLLSGQIASFLPGGWGQLLTVDCSEDLQGLKRVTLGLDFDLNPVCILEDSSVDPQGLITKQDDFLDWSDGFSNDVKWTDMQEGIAYGPDDHDGI